MLEDLEKLVTREPLVSFRIIMSSGTVYEVTSPYQVTADRLRLTYFFTRSDRRAFLSVIDVVAIETVEDDEFR